MSSGTSLQTTESTRDRDAELKALESIREIGPGLKHLAHAVEQAPAAIAHEVNLVKHAGAGGFYVGAGIGLILGFVIGRLLCRR